MNEETAGADVETTAAGEEIREAASAVVARDGEDGLEVLVLER